MTADGSVVVVVDDVLDVVDEVVDDSGGTVVVSVGAATDTAGNAHTPAATTTEKIRRRIGLTLSMGDTGAMGFNPTRKRVARGTDVWFVAAAVVVSLALVMWAFLG